MQKRKEMLLSFVLLIAAFVIMSNINYVLAESSFSDRTNKSIKNCTGCSYDNECVAIGTIIMPNHICGENGKWETRKEKESEKGNLYKNITKEKNKLKIEGNNTEIPGNCTKTGSSMKCNIAGGREMIITAGKSGNIIVQIKGINMSTQVELYKYNGSLYGNLKNNKTKKINYLPDHIHERIREKTRLKLNNSNITLNENGEYEYEADKESRFLGIFKTKEHVRFHIDSETGEILNSKAPWWGFLASDMKKEVLLGESCGTVTPGTNDVCCQNKGYDYWNSTAEECGFK
jgi:hypothetical protein